MKNVPVFASVLFFVPSVFAGATDIRSVPVLDSWGLVAISAAVAIVGLFTLKRK